MVSLNSRQDYIDAGIDPPDIIPHGTAEELALDRKDNHIHYWQQRGNDVWCDRGEHRHGRLVPPTHILEGTTAEGAPIYRIIDNNSLV